MKTLPIEMKENGIRYILHGDYYLQNLILPETRKRPIGRYGRMRLDRKKLFLKMGLSHIFIFFNFPLDFRRIWNIM